MVTRSMARSEEASEIMQQSADEMLQTLDRVDVGVVCFACRPQCVSFTLIRGYQFTRSFELKGACHKCVDVNKVLTGDAPVERFKSCVWDMLNSLDEEFEDD
jgi:maleate cis-trans isomerase